MNFPLDEQRIAQIIFAMEDQQSSYVVDPDSGDLHAVGEAGAEGPGLVPIPEWGPAHGFQLMERFVAGLRNPLLREQLKEALASGKGVFRKYKDILKTRPRAEQLWFSFKEREMRRLVREWYNDEREVAGLQRLPEEPEEEREEVLDLVAGDFTVRAAGQRDLEAVRALDRLAFAEAQPGGGAAEGPGDRSQGLQDAYLRGRRHAGQPLDPDSLLRVAETPGGEIAGFFWAAGEREPLTGERRLRLVQLAVAPAYRGLGLGGVLLERLVGEARDLGCRSLLCTLRGAGLPLEAKLRRAGFLLRSATYELNPALREDPALRGNPALREE